MKYTIKKLSELSGVSRRTLRYYDEIGLLKPGEISSSGYRIYTQKEIDKLQQILIYRKLGVNLKDIKKIINSEGFDDIKALQEHRKKLLQQKEQLASLINNVEKTIRSKERRITMSNDEKFEGFKKRLIKENEEKYGQEIIDLYGEEVIKKSNEKITNMSKEEYERMTNIEDKLMKTLQAAMKTGNPAGEPAQKAADLHRQWLSFYWGTYNKEAHAGLVQIYVTDERFKQYYDKNQSGTAEFLRNAVLFYTRMEQ
ncbi:MAG: MerR family transcriptional regulator [Eubacteriaceae bacterium]